MFYLLVASNVIQIFCNFFILDNIPILKKYNLILSSIILIITYNLGIYTAQVNSIVLFVLLFALSFMNNRTHLIGKILLHLSLAFLLTFVLDYLSTSFLIKIILSNNNVFMLLWFCFSLGINALSAFLVRKFLLLKLSNKWLSISGYIVFSCIFLYQLYHLNNYIQTNPIDFQFETLLKIFNIFIILLVFIVVTSVVILKRNQKLALESQKKRNRIPSYATLYDRTKQTIPRNTKISP